MGADLFDFAAQCLEQQTSFSRLEARGTLRIALKSAGLDPKTLSVDQLRVVFEKLMPGELEHRGVSDAASVCGAVIGDLANSPSSADGAASDNVDGIFRRLGGDN
jgi:hypothetical protein